MSFISWLTGKPSSGEIELHVNEAEAVIDSLNEVEAVTITNAKSSVLTAVTNLNNVHGIEKIDGKINNGIIEEVFTNISDILKEQITNPLQNDVEAIKKFNADDEGGVGKRILASTLMAASNVGEGFLSAFEDIGDAILVAGAWTTRLFGLLPENNLSQSLENIASKDLSHSLFDKLYYSTDLAKSSYFTENSGAASIFRGIGQATGYITMGGWLSGASESLSAAGKFGKAATWLKSTTYANTAVAAVGGLGSGSEIGLQSGYGLGKATLLGAKEAVIQGGMAFAAGKLGEKLAKSKAVKTAQGEVDKADDAFKTAQKELSDADDAVKAAKNDVNKALGDRAQAAKDYNDADIRLRDAKDQLDAAEKSLNPFGKKGKVANAKQAVTDAENELNKLGVKYDDAKLAVDTARSKVAPLEATANAKQAAAQHADDVFKDAQQALADAKAGVGIQGYSDKLTEVARNKGIKSGEKLAQSIDNAVGSATGGAATRKTIGAVVKSAVSHPVGKAATLAKDTLLSPINAVKAVTSAATSAPGAGKIAVGSAAYVAANALKDTTADVAEAGLEGLGVSPENAKFWATNETKAAGGNFDNRVGATPKGSETPSDTQAPPIVTQKPTEANPISTQSPTATNPLPTGNPFDNQEQEPVEDNPDEMDDYVGGNYNNYPYSSSGGETYTPTQTTTETPSTSEEVEEPTGLEIEEVTPTVPTATIPTTTTEPVVTVTPTKVTPTATTPTSITTPPSNTTPAQTTVTTGGGITGGYTGGTTTHTGGGYTESEGFTDEELIEEVTEPELEDLTDDASTSIDEIINGTNTYTKIPTSSTPIEKPTSSKKGNAFIPIAAGLSAAAAAGIGAKAYLDRKKNSDNGEDEEDYADDWTDSDNIEIDENQTTYHEQYLNEDYNNDDEYTTNNEFNTNVEEKYDARTNEELADIQ